jgi:hypothetical protein
MAVPWPMRAVPTHSFQPSHSGLRLLHVRSWPSCWRSQSSHSALLPFLHSIFLCDLTHSVVLNTTLASSLQPPSAPDTHLSLLDIFIFQEKWRKHFSLKWSFWCLCLLLLYANSSVPDVSCQGMLYQTVYINRHTCIECCRSTHLTFEVPTSWLSPLPIHEKLYSRALVWLDKKPCLCWRLQFHLSPQIGADVIHCQWSPWNQWPLLALGDWFSLPKQSYLPNQENRGACTLWLSGCVACCTWNTVKSVTVTSPCTQCLLCTYPSSLSAPPYSQAHVMVHIQYAVFLTVPETWQELHCRVPEMAVTPSNMK